MGHRFLLESAPQLNPPSKAGKAWRRAREYVKFKRCLPPRQSKWRAFEGLTLAPETLAAVVPTVLVVAAAPQNRDQTIRGG